MNKKRPLIITFIGYIRVFSAIISIIVSVIALFPSVFERMGFNSIPIPILSNNTIRLLCCIVLLIASYGFLRLKSWGYWILIIYDILFLVLYIIGYTQNKYLFNPILFIRKFIMIIFVLPTQKYFYEENINLRKQV